MDFRLAAALVAGNFAAVFISAMLPTPLYPLYRESFGFGGITLTVIYAVYVLGNMAAMVFFGRLSDQIGRRKVAILAILAAVISTLVFLFAESTAWLYPARVLSGFSTGLVAGSSAAWIAELYPAEQRPTAALVASAGNFMGVGLGPLIGGMLATFAPSPLHLPFAVYLCILVVDLLAIRTVPETVPNTRTRWSEISLKPRFGVPASIRMAFLSPGVTGFSIFSLIGFYGALIPGLVAGSLGVANPLVSGSIVFELFIVATIALALGARLTPRTAMLSCLVLLPASLWLLMLAEHLHSLWVVAIATFIGGIAAAFGYRGSLQVVNAICPPGQRSEVVSVLMFCMFAGNAIPVIGIAVLASATSPPLAHAAFAGVITCFSVLAFFVGHRMLCPEKT
jgi:predicted MFS family arabinose efflux permease